MNQGTAETSDKVTVLVFKDNYAARTFQIPLRWISKFGIFLGILSITTGASAFFAVKYYRIALRSDPTRVQELEQELTDLKINLKNLESKAVETASHSPQTIAQPSVQTSGANSAPAHATAESPSTQSPSSLGPAGMPSFLAFPVAAQAQTQIPDPASLPFTIQSVKLNWRGRSLRVHFALQYTKSDKGNQDGRILILARGPDSLFAYPSGTVNRVGTANLLSPEKGEFFSVSRFREVNADLGPVRTKDSIREVEILVFDNDGKIISYQKHAPAQEPSPKKKTTESPPPAEPVTTESATTEPAPKEPTSKQPTIPPATSLDKGPPATETNSTEHPTEQGNPTQ